MAIAMGRKFFFMFCLVINIDYIVGVPERGRWELKFTWTDEKPAKIELSVAKSMGSGTEIYIQAECPGYDAKDGKTDASDDSNFLISYQLRQIPVCTNNNNVKPKDVTPESKPELEKPQQNVASDTQSGKASPSKVPENPGSDAKSTSGKPPENPKDSVSDEKSDTGNESGKDEVVGSDTDKKKQPGKTRRKREDPIKSSPDPLEAQGPNVPLKQEPVIVAYSITQDGYYNLTITVDPYKAKKIHDVLVTVMMKSSHGYLSLTDYPLLIVYGFMCAVYIVLGLVWLFLLACNWRDLLRMQFWIGAVILLGMIEKAVFVAEYDKLNNTGSARVSTLVFAELVSCLKRTLARILVIIASLGFGIVKPRLGPMLHRVLGVGALYFIFAAVESCIRVIDSRNNHESAKRILIASVPLALMDAVICWWIFASLWQTVRTLRLRRNIVKLTLYRHFTNTLIFAVIASLAFFIWYLTQNPVINGSVDCIISFRGKWLTEAFWPLLFSSILVVIMVLWRPTVNNQRYAFSPLLDADEDDVDDAVMNDAFEGMKMRAQKNGSPRPKDISSKAEDDLKWIEENIPATLADKALPSILDSDDEIMTTKFEMSKME